MHKASSCILMGMRVGKLREAKTDCWCRNLHLCPLLWSTLRTHEDEYWEVIECAEGMSMSWLTDFRTNGHPRCSSYALSTLSLSPTIFPYWATATTFQEPLFSTYCPPPADIFLLYTVFLMYIYCITSYTRYIFASKIVITCWFFRSYCSTALLNIPMSVSLFWASCEVVFHF